MRIFLIGTPRSGRSTVANALIDQGFQYLHATSWLRSLFRNQEPNEHLQQYEDAYCEFVSERLLNNPNLIVDNLKAAMKSHSSDSFVIDGLSSPRDFAHLFDYRTDVVVFLNRLDNDHEHLQDRDNIALSCTRDYCFWLSSAGLLPRSRWLEFNFRMIEDNSDYLKTLGSKNSVFIVKSIRQVITHLRELLRDI